MPLPPRPACSCLRSRRCQGPPYALVSESPARGARRARTRSKRAAAALAADARMRAGPNAAARGGRIGQDPREPWCAARAVDQDELVLPAGFFEQDVHGEVGVAGVVRPDRREARCLHGLPRRACRAHTMALVSRSPARTLRSHREKYVRFRAESGPHRRSSTRHTPIRPGWARTPGS